MNQSRTVFTLLKSINRHIQALSGLNNLIDALLMNLRLDQSGLFFRFMGSICALGFIAYILAFTEVNPWMMVIGTFGAAVLFSETVTFHLRIYKTNASAIEFLRNVLKVAECDRATHETMIRELKEEMKNDNSQNV